MAQVEPRADGIVAGGMMDGQVGAIRDALDDAGFEDAIILAYAASTSALYGPFQTSGRRDHRGRRGPAKGTNRTATNDAISAGRDRISTSKRAPTWSWSSRRSPIST